MSSSVVEVYLFTTDVAQLLESGSLTKHGVDFKMSAHKLICGIASCPWEAIDGADLNTHVGVSHRDNSLVDGIKKLQVVLKKSEIQELAVQGTMIIGKFTFTVVEPVKFLFEHGGGEWFSTSGKGLASIQAEQTGGEAQSLRQINQQSAEMTTQLAAKDRIIKAEQDEKNALQLQMDEISEKLSKALATLPAAIGGRAMAQVTSNHGTGDPDRQETPTVVGASISTARQGVPAIAVNNSASNQRSGAIANPVITDVQRMHRHINRLRREKNVREPLVSDSIASQKRALIYALEGMTSPRDSVPLTDVQRAKVQYVMRRGYEAEHHANVRAQLAMFQIGQMSLDELRTFEKMYGFHPQKFESMLVTEDVIWAWNMMGTVAGCLARVKLGSGAAQYEEFLNHAAKLNEIRTKVEEQVGKSVAAGRVFDMKVEVQHHLEEMCRLGDIFVAIDKFERSNSQ